MSGFTIGTATFTENSTSVTGVVLSQGNIGSFVSGTQVYVDTGDKTVLVEGIRQGSQQDTFVLRSNWALSSGSYSFVATMTSEGIRDAAQALREAAEELEQAQDVIAAIGEVYSTVGDGLAATTNGEIFFVGGEGDNFIIQYINDNGTADERSRLPSSALIQQAIAAVEDAQNAAASAEGSKQHIDNLFAEFGIALDEALNGG